MSVLTTEQINALNAFVRSYPSLARVFDYTASGTKEGLGDALNSEGSGGGPSASTAFAFFIGHVGA